MKRSAELFHMPPYGVAAFERIIALIDLKNGVDTSEREDVRLTTAQVENEGKTEIDALENGKPAALKVKKKSEDSSDTVATY